MKKTVFCLALAGLIPALMSCSANADNDALAAVKKTFQQKFSDRQVLGVRLTPVKGLDEIDMQGAQVVYVDQKVDYVFVGDMVEVKTGKSRTEARVAELSQVPWNALPLNDAIKEVRGNGARKLAIFTDPDCPFCRQLEQGSLAAIDNVTIYTFLYPLTQLHPDAMHKARQIWCAPDRLQAWTAYMHDGKALSGADNCDTPLERIHDLGEKLGIDGTPTLIFGNGHLVAGVLAQDQLESGLNAQ
jgi:thiol:disulfide interchange protein DsbC